MVLRLPWLALICAICGAAYQTRRGEARPRGAVWRSTTGKADAPRERLDRALLSAALPDDLADGGRHALSGSRRERDLESQRG